MSHIVLHLEQLRHSEFYGDCANDEAQQCQRDIQWSDCDFLHGGSKCHQNLQACLIRKAGINIKNYAHQSRENTGHVERGEQHFIAEQHRVCHSESDLKQSVFDEKLDARIIHHLLLRLEILRHRSPLYYEEISPKIVTFSHLSSVRRIILLSGFINKNFFFNIRICLIPQCFR